MDATSISARTLCTGTSPAWCSITSSRPALTRPRQAEAFFRRALEVKPDHVEARLRHGRVLGGLGRHADAAAELRQAIASADDTLLVYYGNLFLGAAEEELGHRDAARLAYEQAAASYPDAQSPLVALSRLARRYGDRP